MVEQCLAAEFVAEILDPGKTGRIDRNHRLVEFPAGGLADRFDVVPDHGGDAGLIDEHGRGIVLVDDLFDRLEQPFLAAVDDIELVDVGGKAGAIGHRPGRQRVAVVPGVAFAGDRSVHQMCGIRDRLQRDLGAVESAAAGGCARRELLGASLFALFFRLALVLAAGRLFEHLQKFAGERIHRMMSKLKSVFDATMVCLSISSKILSRIRTSTFIAP